MLHTTDTPQYDKCDEDQAEQFRHTEIKSITLIFIYAIRRLIILLYILSKEKMFCNIIMQHR